MRISVVVKQNNLRFSRRSLRTPRDIGFHMGKYQLCRRLAEAFPKSARKNEVADGVPIVPRADFRVMGMPADQSNYGIQRIARFHHAP